MVLSPAKPTRIEAKTLVTKKIGILKITKIVNSIKGPHRAENSKDQ